MKKETNEAMELIRKRKDEARIYLATMSARSVAEEFVAHARSMAETLRRDAKQIEEWLEGGDLTKWHGVNSLGPVQGQGSNIDRLAVLINVYHEQLKAEKKA